MKAQSVRRTYSGQPILAAGDKDIFLALLSQCRTCVHLLELNGPTHPEPKGTLTPDMRRCVWRVQQAYRASPPKQRKSKIETNRSRHFPKEHLLSKRRCHALCCRFLTFLRHSGSSYRFSMAKNEYKMLRCLMSFTSLR